MKASFIRAITAASLLTTTAAAPAVADNLGAALVGGLIGGVIMNEANKNKRRTVQSNTNSATRTYNRETQTALNYFGFPAGTPDGVFGSRSRDASRQYQIYMGFPQTGNLSQYERDFLVSSYNRALVGGPQVIKAMQSPQGTRSLLKTWHGAPVTGGAGSYGYAGLPMEVSEAVDEIAAAGDPTGDQLLQRTGFMQLADLNQDGRNDYLIDTAAAGIPYWCSNGGATCTVMVFASTPQGYERNDFTASSVTTADFTCTRGECDRIEAPVLAASPAPQALAPAPAPAPQSNGTVLASGGAQGGLGGIQLFQAPAPQAASLTSHCSKVSLLTSSNGGYMTVANITDPELALGEQFCLARSYAINRGETLVAGLQGVTSAQVDAQCDQFGPALQPFVSQLGAGDSTAVVAAVQKFILQSNMSVAQLQNTAEICLFSGYRRDNMDVALGAGLLLVGLGQHPYAELIGHHMALGFGASVDQPRAQGWYNAAVSALENGAEPVFAPGQPERVALVKAASQGLTQPGLPQPVQASGGAAALPTFGIKN